MDSFINEMVFSIYDNELIKTNKDLHLFIKKFLKTLQTYEYESIDLTATSSDDENEDDIEPTTSDEDFICDIEESESSDNDVENDKIFICDICKEKCMNG